MRGSDSHQDGMFRYLSPAERVPQDHPLRPIKAMVNQALSDLWAEFQAMYAKVGRPSIAPEKLLRALLLQVLYTIRSERLLMEQLDSNLLFRGFVGLSMDDEVWDHSVFSKNRERLIASDVAGLFFACIKAQAEAAGLLSDEHFTVDGTLIEAWASLKNFRISRRLGLRSGALWTPTTSNGGWKSRFEKPLAGQGPVVGPGLTRQGGLKNLCPGNRMRYI